MSLVEDSCAALREITERMGGGIRDGQMQMVSAVAGAIARRGRLAVEAPTGTGKGIGYLVPIAVSGQRALIVTSSISLQDQLVDLDLPAVAAAVDPSLTFRSVKGRGNYVCAAKAAELRDAAKPGSPLALLAEWALTGEHDGDRRNAPAEVSEDAWSMIAVQSDECPGASSCPHGGVCFSERARIDAKQARVVVANMHLFGMHAVLEGVLEPTPDKVDDDNPGFDVIVVDEAHDMLDVGCTVNGAEVTPVRLRTVAKAISSVDPASQSAVDLRAIAAEMERTCKTFGSQVKRISPADEHPFEPLLIAAMKALESPWSSKPSAGESSERARVRARIEMLSSNVASLLDNDGESWVRWVTDRGAFGSPLSIARQLASNVWRDRPVVVCSATMPGTIVRDLGLAVGVDIVTGLPLADGVEVRRASVPSPFDFDSNALLYVASRLSSPTERDGRWEREAIEECSKLVAGSGGGAMVLCTSSSAVERFATRLRADGHRVFAQGDASRSQILKAFTEDHDAVLVATRSFWQGVSVSGDTCRLVVIDRIPIPRPDDPLVAARREIVAKRFEAKGMSGREAHWAAFAQVDVPLAATALAQGVGRLIRTMSDRGVVAVLDPRLATAKYKAQLLAPLEMPLTTDVGTAVSALHRWFGVPAAPKRRTA